MVVELKSGPFKPEYAGKIDFSLAAVDAQLKQPEDGPSIGMNPCKTKKRLWCEYTLQDSRRPIGVASYTTKLAETLPRLPTIEEIEARLFKDEDKKRSLMK